MIVIGGGIGGMLTAALGRKAVLFEKAPVLGGRFRNINVDGFQLTTGALHMVPHATGILPRLLEKMGAGVTITISNPPGSFLLTREYGGRELLSFLGFFEGISLTKMLLEMKSKDAPLCSMEEYMRKKSNSRIIHALLASFCGWSLSMHPKDVPAHEFFLIVRNILEYGGPGIPAGGCSGIIDALERVCNLRNNKIIHKKVKNIIVEDNAVEGVVDEDGIVYEDKIVVSDIGAKATSKLCKFQAEYQKMIDAIKSSSGIKISIATKESLVGHTGVLFTPNCKRVCGVNQVTNAEPSLAPEGWHLVMSHQPMLAEDVRKESDLGLADIERLFGEKKYKILAVQPFMKDHPVNRAAFGYDMDQKTPIEGLYLVGDCAKMPGGMEVEGIAQGVKKLAEVYLPKSFY